MDLKHLILQSRPSRRDRVPPSPPVYVPPVPIGHWRFDTADISGASVADHSGNGRTGALVGSPALVAGIVGDQAVQLVNTIATAAAADQYMSHDMTVGTPWPLTLPKFSVTFWAKDMFLPGNFVNEVVLNIGSIPNGGAALRVLYNRTTRVGWNIEVPFGVVLAYARFNTFAPNGSGTHFYAATWDSTIASNGRFFRDDAVEASLTAGQNLGVGVVPDLSASDHLVVGGSTGSLVGVRDGIKATVDDVRLYDRTLTPQEISNIFNGLL